MLYVAVGVLVVLLLIAIVSRRRRPNAFSQNVRFTRALDSADASVDPHARGEALMTTLCGALPEHGWAPSEIDNWRDSGWAIVCRRDGAEIDLVLARSEETEWIMQLVPHGERRLKASRDHVFELAKATHRVLERAGARGFMWCWDAFPTHHRSTRAPTPWAAEELPAGPYRK